MLRLFIQWQLVFVAAVALASIGLPNVGVQAQDVPAAATPNPEVTTAPIVTDASTSTAPAAAIVPPSEATKSVTEPVAKAGTPETVEAPTTPVVTEAVTTITPASTLVPRNASTPVGPTEARVSTTLPPRAAPSVSQVTSESSATTLPESTSSYSTIPDNDVESNLRGSDVDSIIRGGGDAGTASASSMSSSSNSASEPSTGILNGFFSTTTIVLLMLGGIGLAIIMSLLFVLWRNQRRDGPDLETPVLPDTTTTTFPAVSRPSIAAPSAWDLSSWKASESSFTSRDLPLTGNARAKLNAVTRLSTGYDMANRHSHVNVYDPLTQAALAIRETNASSDQSFSIREYSECSILPAADLEAETPVMTNESDSASDGYSTGDRYSASGKYSASSRLSSEPGRSSSVWSQPQASKDLDIHRYSSTSSTASSIVARNHNPASYANQDRLPRTDTPVTTDSTTSRTDIPNWYSVIESPTDIGRYTASSLDSDRTSNGRESFEL